MIFTPDGAQAVPRLNMSVQYATFPSDYYWQAYSTLVYY